MLLFVTADLHFNHRASQASARQTIGEINQSSRDLKPAGLLVVGDAAVADGNSLEECLSLFTIDGPKYFVAGNHELWTLRPDSREIFESELPERIRQLGWNWLEDVPARFGSTALIGNIGWYDYSFAEPSLQIPHRFYARGVSPAVASRFSQFDGLFTEPLPTDTTDLIARWNDKKFVKLHQTDEAFLDQQLATLLSQLEQCRDAERTIVAVHHVPFRELLPPRHGGQWDFARAYLGSESIGELIRQFPSVDTVLCGHSHMPAEAQIGNIRAINIGSGYRQKRFVMIDT